MAQAGSWLNGCYSGAAVALIAVSGVLLPTSAHAFMEDTRLLDLSTGTSLVRTARSYQNDGYELSDGSQLIFGDWYRPDWPEVQVKFLTMIQKDIGFIWGFGTGEEGGQYRVDPSLHLGFVAEREIGRSQTLSFLVTGIFGGRLSERPCTANYGAIGGTQAVNCRLAATPMRPSATLDYLFDESPPDRFLITLRYQFEF